MENKKYADDEFDVESHYESKIKNGSLKDQGIILRFNKPTYRPSNPEIIKGLRRIAKDRFKYEDFIEINKIHSAYLKELKGNLSPKGFLDILYKSELTGAMIDIAGKSGFVIEERKNSISVIFPENIVKLYIKSCWNFKINFEGVDYLFFCNNLKNNRFLKN